MDPSAIVGIVLGVGLLALIVAAAVRMSKKKPYVPSAGDEAEADEALPEPKRGPSPLPAPQPEADEKRRTTSQQRPIQAGRAAPAPAPEPAPEPVPEKPKVVALPIAKARPIAKGLERTRKEGFIARIVELFRPGTVDAAVVAQVEENLLTADIGVKTANELVAALKNEFKPEAGDLAPQVLRFLKAKVSALLAGLPHGMQDLTAPDGGPAVMMVVGVNGTGKTTNIAKLANIYKARGRKVILAAGDTYRAAGADQLAIWGERIDVPVVVGAPNADPASVIFDAAKRARDEGFDLLIVDTAGRLHTNVNLVDELKKIARVIGKAVPGAPHEVLLMLDATMGQNAVHQADIFRQAVNVTGIALSKLDGTAKGGVVLSIARDMGLPIRFVGVGEAVDDLKSFDADDFADELFEEVN